MADASPSATVLRVKRSLPIKTISVFIITLLALFNSVVLYADDLRVTVNPFESKVGDKDLVKKVAIESAREVMRSKGFKYISNTEFFTDVIGEENMQGARFTNLENEYSEEYLKKLEELVRPHKGFDKLDRAIEASDITLGGTVSRVGGLIEVDLTIVNLRSADHETYEEVVKCEEEHLNKEVREKTGSLLSRMLKGMRVYADKLTDKELSKVVYEVMSVDRQVIGIEMDFTGTRPNPEVQNVRIIPPEGLDANKSTTLKIRSQEGKAIDIAFNYKTGQLDSILVNAKIPDPSSSAAQKEVLTVKSRMGYLLAFTFEWNGKEMKSVRLDPKVNPFGGNEE
jgi:hypothetical protein